MLVLNPTWARAVHHARCYESLRQCACNFIFISCHNLVTKISDMDNSEKSDQYDQSSVSIFELRAHPLGGFADISAPCWHFRSDLPYITPKVVKAEVHA